VETYCHGRQRIPRKRTDVKPTALSRPHTRESGPSLVSARHAARLANDGNLLLRPSINTESESVQEDGRVDGSKCHWNDAFNEGSRSSRPRVTTPTRAGHRRCRRGFGAPRRMRASLPMTSQWKPTSTATSQY